ncbi:hypothetical protein [Aquabacterium sp. OR-4]|uniref:hypothetical protein n=1 Tax=Aquabacterium sp. OR-4 TaxID=2978127 RepID=UPI0021B251DC|nr:hypothetical protein [Aquabacterium sp. OR-4]MDT7837881.1 hypothetical protein [Aquabacterium sp. OR-4]
MTGDAAGHRTTETLCGQGIGRQLIEAVYAQAQRAGSARVHRQTHTTKAAGCALYDKLAQQLGFIAYGHELGA